MYRKLWNGAHKVYLASLEKDGETYLKVGTTCYLDAMDRFRYCNDKYPISDVFKNIRICASWTVSDIKTAKEIERKILNAWGPKEFRIEKYCGGITDIRPYSAQRYAIAKYAINSLRK